MATLSLRVGTGSAQQRQGRVGEAEAQWRAVLAEKDDMKEAWKGLAELCVMQGRAAEAEMIIQKLEAGGHGDASLLRGRLHFERKEYADVRRVVGTQPETVPGLRLLSYALLQEDTDHAAAEETLCKLIKLAPADAEARHNLHLLRQRRQRAAS